MCSSRVADQAEGLGGLGQVHRHEVGLGEQRVEVDQADAHLRGAAGLDVGVVGDDVHAERREPLRDEDADPAEADDADGLLVQLDAGVLRPLPLALPQRGVRRADVAGGGEHQRDGELGGGDDVGRRRVDDHHAGLGRRADVDVVEPHAGAGDDLEPRCGGERLGVDRGGASGPAARRRRPARPAARRGRRRCSAGSRSPGPSSSMVAGLSSSAISTTGLPRRSAPPRRAAVLTAGPRGSVGSVAHDAVRPLTLPRCTRITRRASVAAGPT